MMRSSLVVLHLGVVAASTTWRCPASSSSNRNTAEFAQRVEEQYETRSRAMTKVACYPHHILTRPALPIAGPDDVRRPLFSTRLMELNKVASDVGCISFSAPKGHWDASVILIKNSPNEEEFEVWVNPVVPGYDDRTSVAPMYGMWENCVSCGACHAWVVRPQRITCRGMDAHGNEKMEVMDGMRARCLMHELDHIHGKSIIQQAMGPEFVVSGIAMWQRDLWPANFPSAEAFHTGQHQFFDYVTNTVVIPPGLEWWHAQSSMNEFDRDRLGTR